MTTETPKVTCLKCLRELSAMDLVAGVACEAGGYCDGRPEPHAHLRHVEIRLTDASLVRLPWDRVLRAVAGNYVASPYVVPRVFAGGTDDAVIVTCRRVTALEAEDLAQRLTDGAPVECRPDVAAALDLAVRYGGIDGDHHKAWVIDQIVRALAGPGYDELVRKARAGEDGPASYDWDVGIAP